MADLATAGQLLRTVFGFGSFRAGEAEIIETILSGRDVLAVMPAGSGSTPLVLATQNTGRGGIGTPDAKAQQHEILRLLEQHGASGVAGLA